MKTYKNKLLLIVCAALSLSVGAEEIAPVEKPSENISPIKVENKTKSFFWKLAPQISWLRASSKSSNQYQISSISALSKVNPGFIGELGVHSGKNSNVFLFTSLSDVRFYEDGNHSLSKDSFLRQSFGVGGKYRFEDVNYFELRFGFNDEFYLTMPNSKTVDIEKVKIPELQWSYRHAYGQYKGVAVETGVTGKVILPYITSKIEGKFGYGVGADLTLDYKNKGMRFFYSYNDARATDKSTIVHELGWMFIFKGKFFE